MQEALFRAWLKWDKIGSYQDPEGWVRRVAINVATSRWRKLRRLAGQSASTALQSLAAPSVELTEDSLIFWPSFVRCHAANVKPYVDHPVRYLLDARSR